MSSNTRSPISALIRDAVEGARVVVRTLEPTDVPFDDAVDMLGAFAEMQRLGEAGVVLLAARAAQSGEWQRAGRPSPADWLALQQGTSVGRAHADLATSRRLDGLPATGAALRAGALSAEQAGAVAGAAAVNPQCERRLLRTARTDSLKHLREEAARCKADVEDEADKQERERKVHAERSARYGTSRHRWWLRLSGPSPTGAAAQQQLENRIGDLMRCRNRTSDAPAAREGRDQLAYDAVMERLCDDVVSVPSAKANDVDPVGSSPRRRRRTTANRLMLVRVDLAALIRGKTAPGEMCEIPGVGPVSVDEARRMFGDSVLALVTTNGPAVIDVVNLSRRPTVNQQIAKLWTDPKCVVAGCNRTIRIEYEHRIDWKPSQQKMLLDSEHMCSACHSLKTHHDYQLVSGRGRRSLVPPGHPSHPATVGVASADPPLADTG